MAVATPIQDATGVWDIDASHSSAEFAVRHMVISTTRGGFKQMSGKIQIDTANPSNSSVEATIDVNTIETRDERRDGHLKSADFFEVERFPTIDFKSKSVQPIGGNRYRVVGDLTIRDVTREVPLDVTFEGQARDPWCGTRSGFEAETRINREDFGLTYNSVLETGGVLVGTDIKISLHIEGIKAA